MTAVKRNRIVGLVIAVAIFVIDQAIKALMVGPLKLQQVRNIELLPFFDLTWTENRGISLGMFQADSPEMRWGLVALTGAIAIVVLVWLLRERKMWEIAPLALILGGAVGNIRDRMNYAFVIDYADFHIGEFRPFLVFNLADAAISIGVVIILARALFISEKPAAPQGGEDQADKPAEIS